MPQKNAENSKTFRVTQETIELTKFSTFSTNTKRIQSERTTHKLENINATEGSRTYVSSGTPGPPSTGTVGRNWKWSKSIDRSPSTSSTGKKWKLDSSDGSRARNISITSTTSHESVSSSTTDISPYIHLIHSDSFIRKPREVDRQLRRTSSSDESMQYIYKCYNILKHKAGFYSMR